MTFDLSRLAAKQKRLKDWTLFANNEVSDQQLKQRTTRALAQFQQALSSCWEKNEVTASDIQRIEDLERQLEQLNDEARLQVGTR